MNAMKFFNNDEGVSPIVATLVLIVVAIIGAAAVGLIMGSFSNSVSGQANSNNVSAGASNTILVGGSTTLYPGDLNVAKDYMNNHQGLQINNQQGGSDAGVAGVGLGALDIGAASRALTAADLAKYPNLQQTEVAGSAVVVIGNTVGATDVTKSQLYNLYTSGVTFGTVTKAVQRADGSGTEETFAKWLTSSDATVSTSLDSFASLGTADSETGNEGILAYVQTHTGSLGFVDWGYVSTSTKLGAAKILGITNAKNADVTAPTVTYTAANVDGAHILAQLKATSSTESTTGYVPGLVKHCYLITNGKPTPVIADFISFAQSPGGAADFDAAGMFGVTEYA